MSDRPLIAPSNDQPLIGIGSKYNSGSMAGSITGPASIIQRLPGISYSVVWSGTPTGTFTVQVSNDYSENRDGSVRNAGSWSDLPSSSFQGTYPAPAGSGGNGMLDVNVTNVYAIRLNYTRVSGTGQLTVIPCAKVL